MSFAESFKTYYSLTKPGIIRGNLITAIAGFFLAVANSGQTATPRLLVLLSATLAGLALVVAAACVCNNYLDRGIDAKMRRTRKRALAAQRVSGRNALIYAMVLFCAGMALLIYMSTPAAAGLALAGFIAYVALYGWAKRHTRHGTAVGSISGAIPPAVGYSAVAGQLDLAALLLFAILVCWQMPHFFAIAIYRLNDYESAGIPVLPAVKGIIYTRRQILAWIGGLAITTPSLAVFGYAGRIYAAVALATCLAWLWSAWRSDHADIEQWARRIFLQSLVVICVLCTGIAVGGLLP